MSEAVAVSRRYLGRENIECLSIGEEATSRALELLERHALGRNRIVDTLLAATLLVSGVTELVTCNPRGFNIFEGLRTVDPSRPNQPHE